MTHVVCVGDLMVDVVALLPGPLAVGSDTPAPVSTHGGGAAANVAAWVAASGARATFVGRAGNDVLGREAITQLRSGGVDARVEMDGALPTGSCIVLVAPSGERTMIPSPGANNAPVDITVLPDTADWLYLSGYALLNPGSRPSALAALDVARERGWSIAVDPASAAPLAAAGAEAFLDWIGTGLLVLPNSDEALVLTGARDAEIAARRLADRLGQAVVKTGAAGAVWSGGRDVVRVAGQPAAVLDTTGAGDAFAGGFLATEGDVPARLTAAVRLGAVAVAQAGARPRHP